MRGHEDGINIKQVYADKLSVVLDRYWREKQLMVGLFYIVAHHDVASFGAKTRKRKICCPIIYFPCELSKSKFISSPCVKPNLSRGVINPAAKQFFSEHIQDVDKLLDQLLATLKQPFDNDTNNPYSIITKLHKEFTKSTSHWQTVTSNKEKSTARCLKNLKQGVLHIVDEALIYVSRKQVSAQGSLYEIEEIIKRDDVSSALAPILENKNTLRNESYDSFWNWLPWRKYQNLSLPLPVVLSDAQSTVIENAAKYSLSIAVGPPGTGKSFTIASLALKEFTRGKSVLVVSQNQHAVDVVRRKLIDDFGVDSGLTVLGNDEGLSRDVKEQLNKLLRSSPKFNNENYKALIRQLNRKLQQRQEQEDEFLQCCETKVSGKAVDEKSSNFFSQFMRSSPVKVNAPENKKQVLLSEQFCDLEELDEEINLLTAKLVNGHYHRKINKLLNKSTSRTSIGEFAKSLTARNAYYQERYYNSVNFNDVLGAVPFWFAPLSSLSRLLPLQKELFDIVIIDEATQCNLSVCLPALYRAKNAVIVGDPKQLSHVSFVSYDAQQKMFDQYALNANELSSDFRNQSVLDYAASALGSQNAVSQLDEHFRSHPQVIQFSNQAFYDNSLKVMTTRPNRIKQAIKLQRVDGKRSNGVNRIEANVVVDAVKSLIKQQSELPQSEVQSLGVLSFFSDQAQHIEKKLFNELSLNALRRHNLRVGTPFSFQGEERDHMLISCCIDQDTPSASYTYLNRDDVFNVAITRARDFQTVFLSCEPDQIKINSKLNSYIKYCLESGVENIEPQSDAHDAFQDEIYTWLQEKGIKAYKNYVVAGTSIDLMAVYEDRALAIDLIGFDGNLKGVLSLTQFKLLARAGLKSFLLPYDEWRNDKPRLFEQLLLQIGAMTKLEAQSKSGVAAFNNAEEAFISDLTNGISINQLNTRFVKSNERRAAKQISMLLEKHSRFERALHLCFMPEELTFKRYKNAFHDLIKDCIIKLQQASIASELASSLLDQQKQLFGSAEQSGGEYDDIFEARASMVDEQKNKIQQLLTTNEAALLQMDKTCLKLNRLHESEDENELSSHDILEELTEKIDLYKGVVHKRSE